MGAFIQLSISKATENITCVLTTEEGKFHRLLCNGTEFVEKEEPLSYRHTLFWIYLIGFVVLVLFGGLMSGLEQGLFLYEENILRVIRDGGTPEQKRCAKKIIPLVQKYHWLMVTLIITNAGAYEVMPILLDRISNPIVAVTISVTAVLFFGEILPPAICARHGLEIGAFCKPLVYLLMVVLSPLTWPLGKLLDRVLGQNHNLVFRRNQLKALVDIHGQAEMVGSKGEALTIDEVLIIKGALDMKSKHVGHAMLPLERVFMLPDTAVLEKSTVDKVIHATHSRVPIYHESRDNIVSVLLTKRLTTLPSGSVIRDVVKSRAFRVPPVVGEDMPLYELLNLFQSGKSHFAVVKKYSSDDVSSRNPVTGIITLEYILEQLLQGHIWDESDLQMDIRTRLAMARGDRQQSTDETTCYFLERDSIHLLESKS